MLKHALNKDHHHNQCTKKSRRSKDSIVLNMDTIQESTDVTDGMNSTRISTGGNTPDTIAANLINDLNYQVVNEKKTTMPSSSSLATTTTTSPKVPSSIVAGANTTMWSAGNNSVELPQLWYNILPADNEIDDYLIEPLDELICKEIQEEFRTTSIQMAVDEFQKITSEFLELSARKRELEPSYSKILMNFVNTMCRVYKCKIVPMFVNVNNYTTPQWGPVYWRFLHYSSILLAYAYENKMIASFLDFATIVYQIHLVLPCPTCKSHYMSVRETVEITDTIKYVAFGLPMVGVHFFHNLITKNVDSYLTKLSANREHRRPFLVSDFARTYHCLSFTDETLNTSETYVPSRFDWQPPTHCALATIVGTYTRQTYMRASCRLKTMYNATIALKNNRYRSSSSSSMLLSPNRNSTMSTSSSSTTTLMHNNTPPEPFNISVPVLKVRLLHISDKVFMELTAKQFKYILMRALCLQFQNTELTTEMVHSNTELNIGLVQMYGRHPDVCMELAKRNLTHGPEELRSQNNIVAIINGLKQQRKDSMIVDEEQQQPHLPHRNP